MKRSILLLASFAFYSCIILWSCTNSSQKVDEAQEVVVEAKKELNEAKKEYLEDMHNFRRTTLQKIEANNQSTSALNVNIKNEKKEAKADYKKKITALKDRNDEMKQKMESYTDEGEEKWWEFKTQFNRDMDKLSKEFKDLTEKNI